MRYNLNRLSAIQVKRTSEPGLYSDGGGLCLQVTAGKGGNVGKSYVFRYRSPLTGRMREMGLGSASVIELARARTKAEAARKLVAERKDPIEERASERRRQATETAKALTFKEAADRFLEAHLPTWKNQRHRSQWENTLRDYVFPVFGAVPVDQIDVSLVLRAIEPAWKDKTETASRVRARIERILDWSRARGLRDGENPARWRGHLDQVLPPRRQAQRVKHHPALPYSDLPAFMSELKHRGGMGARALEFTILTASRTSETVGARWREIDFKTGVWTVPAERMKARREHRAPLSPEAVAMLKNLQLDRSGDDWVFPGLKSDLPLSNMAMLMTVRKMGRLDITVHGFRSTFRDWVAERTEFPGEVAEAALAHVVGDRVEAAYRRGDLFEKRRKLMEAWASFCTSQPAMVAD